LTPDLSDHIFRLSGKKWKTSDQSADQALINGSQGQVVFRGVFEHQIDSKGRTSFPAKLREALVGKYSDRLIITTALDTCLHAYPVDEWFLLEAALGRRNAMEPGIKTVMRLYVAQAQECTLDKLGRILIPPVLREHAKLHKEVVWAGMVKVIELWSRDGWHHATAEAKAEAQSADVLRVLSELRQS
jgi:MraZ protein